MSDAPARLLLVEDDEGIGGRLVAALEGQGYRLAWAKSAADAQRQATAVDPPDLVLLDLGLPDLDGVALCRQLRQVLPRAVIVALTARDTEVDVIVTLEAGADDYLTKPFRFAELLARLRAHLRREGAVDAARPASAEPPERLVVGAVELDLTARRCRIRGQPVDLRPKEFGVLEVLLSEAGRAVSRETLMARVWDENWYGSTKTLDMHIAMLRRRLGEYGEDPKRITTLRGYGYRYEREGQAGGN